MKTLCCLLVAIAALVSAGNAAAAKPEPYVLGGLVLADLGGDGAQFGRDIAVVLDQLIGGNWASKKSMSTGADVGLGLRLRGERPVGGAIELRYVRRGANYEFTDGSYTYPDAKVKLKLDYVEVPLLMEFAPSTQSSVQAVFLLGPVFGIRASSKEDTEVAGSSTSTDISDNVAGTHFSGLIGAGMRIRTTGQSAVLVQARYLFGFTNLFDSQAGYDVKPQDISILVGYSIGR